MPLWRSFGSSTVRTAHVNLAARTGLEPVLHPILSVADPEWQSLIKFGLYTGQRLADLASLTWDQIDLERSEIRLVTRKTGKRLIIPIAGPLKTHIDSLEPPDQLGVPVHPRAFDALKQHGKVSLLSHQFVDLMAQVGLRSATSHKATGTGRGGKRQGMDISFHSLRHSAVSLLKDAGIPDAVIMELVGHDSAAMSARYTSIGKESLAKAQEAMPVLDKKRGAPKKGRAPDMSKIADSY